MVNKTRFVGTQLQNTLNKREIGLDLCVLRCRQTVLRPYLSSSPTASDSSSSKTGARGEPALRMSNSGFGIGTGSLAESSIELKNLVYA